jgi:hypothetical protein
MTGQFDQTGNGFNGVPDGRNLFGQKYRSGILRGKMKGGQKPDK